MAKVHFNWGKIIMIFSEGENYPLNLNCMHAHQFIYFLLF